jgi:glycosyltransferase involved in cell wall biosynthesis
MVKIGLDASAKGGPGIFLTRLQACLQEMDAFSLDRPDVWLQLSHKPLPALDVSFKRLIVRTAGGYYYRHYAIQKPAIVPVPWLDNWISRRKNEKLNRPIREVLLRGDGIIFQSEFTRAMVQHFITPIQPGRIILNGVDTHHFSPPPNQTRQGKKGLDILVSHQFRPHKRLHDVIRVVSALRKHLPLTCPVTLHVLGGDSRGAFAAAQSVIQAEHMEACVKFWGLQPAESLPNFYRQCDFMMALPLWDPCPNTVVEAVSCGLPVLTTQAAGGVPEIIGPAGRVLPEFVPMTYLDHHRPALMPKVNVDEAVAETCLLLENLDAYRALAREQALKNLNIQTIAAQYRDYAVQLMETHS